MADKSITAANVLSSLTSFNVKIAAAPITRGQAIYLLAAGTVGLADSNGVAPSNTVEGIALADCGTAQPCIYQSLDANFTPGFTDTAGNTVYLSNTSGGITTTYADIASGSTVIVLGGMLTSTTMKLAPQTYGTKP
jgi:hypothetical protein